MGTNGYVGQLKGPFTADQDLIALVKEDAYYSFAKIIKLAVYSEPTHIIVINGVDIEIGSTGMFEVSDTNITTLSFAQDETSNTFIEYIYNGNLVTTSNS